MGIDNYIYLVETVEKRGHHKVLGVVGLERCARQQDVEQHRHQPL